MFVWAMLIVRPSRSPVLLWSMSTEGFVIVWFSLAIVYVTCCEHTVGRVESLTFFTVETFLTGFETIAGIGVQAAVHMVLLLWPPVVLGLSFGMAIFAVEEAMIIVKMRLKPCFLLEDGGIETVRTDNVILIKMAN